ncbi:MAG: hypothetical protein Q9N26_05260, partial [Aquificota bacterium]|nr:hypothetical protein [Aquificota bacterium]
ACLFGVFGVALGVYMTLKGFFNLPALVHTYTLGFAGMTMIGALFQMIPVVAGGVIERPLLKATLVHISLLIGVLTLVLGFFSGRGLLVGGLFAFWGVVLALLFLAPPLFRLRSYTPTSKGMKYAVVMLGLGAFLGVLTGFSLGGYLGLNPEKLLDLHLTFMLYGWVLILVASVAFQVVEMFFVAPPYPRFLRENFPPLLSLAVGSKVVFYGSVVPDIVISLLGIAFASVTVRNLWTRRRKVRDPLVTLWYISMAFLVASSVAFPFRKSSFDLFLLFLFLFGTFAQTVIMAMMYRIIPFLVWMHLSTKGVKDAPTMHQVIGRGVIWFHTGLHLFSVGTLLAFITTDFSLYSAHLPLYLLSFSLLTFNVGRGVCIYIRLSRS